MQTVSKMRVSIVEVRMCLTMSIMGMNIKKKTIKSSISFSLSLSLIIIYYNL